MPAKRTFSKPESTRVLGQARKPVKMLRVGIYARVSTLDQQIGRGDVHPMPHIAVGTRPVRSPVARILGNRPIGPAIAAHVVKPVRPGPIAEEIKSLAEPLLKRGLQ